VVEQAGFLFCYTVCAGGLLQHSMHYYECLVSFTLIVLILYSRKIELKKMGMN
jgi:hypothetical protein